MLARLLRDNRSGALRSAANGRGFVDERSGKAKRLCGIGTFLRDKCRGFPKLTRTEYRARKQNRTRKPPGKHASSKQIGSFFHRQVHHQLVCGAIGAGLCSCPEGSAPAVDARKNSPAYQMVLSARDFIASERLVVLAGEKVIAEPSVGLGTRFDALCQRADGGALVLVSWKTTGECPFPPELARVSFNAWMCYSVTDASSSEEIVAREHLSQLALELRMLRDMHAIDVREACIAYFSPGVRTHRVVWIEDPLRGYATAWSFIEQNRQK